MLKSLTKFDIACFFDNICNPVKNANTAMSARRAAREPDRITFKRPIDNRRPDSKVLDLFDFPCFHLPAKREEMASDVIKTQKPPQAVEKPATPKTLRLTNDLSINIVACLSVRAYKRDMSSPTSSQGAACNSPMNAAKIKTHRSTL